MSLPMFPLGSVVFPGMSVPLHVFEERYLDLVAHLLQEPDPAQRLFGTVAIREGYEVGDHGAQSVYRVGCLLQLTEVESNDDGSYDIVAVARDRLLLDHMEPGGDHPRGIASVMAEPAVTVDDELLGQARVTFTAYRAALADLQGDPFSGTLPRDPDYLSWTLAALAPLPLAERQALLEAADARERLELVTHLLGEELRVINVLPSLPATQVSRTAWSPN
jgi:Lon protease-like protein